MSLGQKVAALFGRGNGTAVMDPLEEKKQETNKQSLSIECVPEKYGRRVSPRTLEVVKNQITETELDIAELQHAYENAQMDLLPVERLAQEDLSAAHNQAKSAKEQELLRLQREAACIEIDKKYPRIDMSFLSIRQWSAVNNCPVPRFAVFTPDNAKCAFKAHKIKGSYAKPNFNSPYSEFSQYFDLAFFVKAAEAKLETTHSRYDEFYVEMSALFNGVVPSEVKKLIRLNEYHFDKFYLISEVPDWDIKVEVVIKPDPLVIGVKDGVYWLVAQFDVTPTEAFVAQDYTSKQRKP